MEHRQEWPVTLSLLEQRAVRSVGAGFGGSPVDRRAIEHGKGEVRYKRFTQRHASSASTSLTSARCAALRAASGVDLPRISASSG